jgi:hypothetical protein
VTGFGKIDVRQLATAVSSPTLILHATGDARVPFDKGLLAASLIPGARLIPMQSKNHLLIDTEPAWDRYLVEVEHFLLHLFLSTRVAIICDLPSHITRIRAHATHQRRGQRRLEMQTDKV